MSGCQSEVVCADRGCCIEVFAVFAMGTHISKEAFQEQPDYSVEKRKRTEEIRDLKEKVNILQDLALRILKENIHLSVKLEKSKEQLEASDVQTQVSVVTMHEMSEDLKRKDREIRRLQREMKRLEDTSIRMKEENLHLERQQKDLQQELQKKDKELSIVSDALCEQRMKMIKHPKPVEMADRIEKLKKKNEMMRQSNLEIRKEKYLLNKELEDCRTQLKLKDETIWKQQAAICSLQCKVVELAAVCDDNKPWKS